MLLVHGFMDSADTWRKTLTMVSHRGSRHLVAAVPGLSYDLLPGCGHCPQLEQPERFVELLEAFLVERTAAVA